MAPKIITFGTLKGGSGKTSCCFNLSAILAETKKVLLVDGDPQFNLTTDVGIDTPDLKYKTIKNVFEGGSGAEEAIVKSPIPDLPNLDIIPSSIQLTATELNLVSLAGRERVLENFFIDNKEVFNTYDYVLLDTNPNLGIINQNIFLLSDSIILVSDVSFNSIQGAEFFCALWENVRKQLRKGNNIKALILNNADMRSKLGFDLLEFCKGNQTLCDLVVDTIIPASIAIKNAELAHKPLNVLSAENVDISTKEKIIGIYKDILIKLSEKGAI